MELSSNRIRAQAWNKRRPCRVKGRDRCSVIQGGCWLAGICAHPLGRPFYTSGPLAVIASYRSNHPHSCIPHPQSSSSALQRRKKTFSSTSLRTIQLNWRIELGYVPLLIVVIERRNPIESETRRTQKNNKKNLKRNRKESDDECAGQFAVRQRECGY